MRLVVFGRFGLGDAGEDAVLRCMVRALRERTPDVAIAVASFAPDRHRDLAVDVLDAGDDAALSAAVAAADLVVVAGGTCWQDASAWQPVDLFRTPASTATFSPARPLVLAAAVGVRSALFANGVGPLRAAAARRGVAALAALASHVSVRDDESANELRAAGFTGGIAVTADPTFAIVPDATVVATARRQPCRIGVLTSAADPPEVTAAIRAALDDLGTRRAIEHLVLPTLGSHDSGGSESAALADVLTVHPATPEEAAGWLATCDVAVTTRLHGAILAAVAGTPAVAIGADPALQGHARLLGCADLALEPGACTPQTIAARVEQVLTSRAAITAAIGARLAVARGVLDAGYDSLLASAETADRHQSQLAAYERICSRLRARLEEREESWRTLASFFGQEVESVAPVSTGVPQRSRDIQVLKARVDAAESELAAIKRTRGWRMLHQYGVLKYRYLRPLQQWLRTVSRGRRSHSDTPAATDDPAPAVPLPGSFDVVCFPIIDWDFRYQRPQQLMARFAAAGHRVFYVSPHFLPPGAATTVVEKARNVFHVSLPGLPRNAWTQALDAPAVEKLFAALDRVRIDHGLGATLACVQLPFWWPLAALTRERFAWPIVYDCMDDHAGFSTHTGATDADEHALFAAADLAVASSALLFERARRLNDRVMLLPNGCEFEHFAAAARPPEARAARPVIGYYGAIAEWFDADLVADLAERRPDWDFVLVGSTNGADVTRLGALPNVRLPGEQPYAEIPRWLATFDVTLLPFKRTPLTEVTNPVKAYEILAAGKPLISVPLPEMRVMAEHDLVRLAETPAEFERAITAALDPADASHVDARQTFARANTWQARYATLAAAVPSLFPQASTVIVTYNNLALTEACLASLWARTEWPRHEVIVVDNASTDGTPEFLRHLAAERPDVVAICNDRNVGFAAACNQGLARATGTYLVLLNNDTVVTRGWLSGLIRHLHAVPEIGLIGPVTNEIGNEAKIPVDYTAIEAMPAWAARFTREHHDRLSSMRMLAMFCVAMRRDAFTEVGPLDERFGIGMFEDDDYSRRMHGLGYRTVCTSDVFVHHVGGASFKRLHHEHYRQIFAHNKRAYEAKWGLWTPHQDQTAAPRVDRLRDRLAAIVDEARVGADRIVVFLRAGSEPATLVGRTHHLATALAADGMLVFVHAADDGGDEFQLLAPNLWSYRGPSGTLERLEAPILWASPGNALDAFRWLARTVVYDVSEDPNASPVLRVNHERMLRDADVVVCASRALTHMVGGRRADATYLPNADAAETAPSCTAPAPALGAGLDSHAHEPSWAARARTVQDLLRARPRSASNHDPMPRRPPRHAAQFVGKRAHPGTCNICGHATAFYFDDPAQYRESLVCGECLTASRYRSMARGILRAIHALTGVTATSLRDLATQHSPRRLRVYDTQVPFYFDHNAYPIPDLLAACDWIDVEASAMRPREPLGRVLGPHRTNQNLERLTFPDGAFDVVLTSDVMEHVRLDERAHREIRRVLAPDGVYVFTVPHEREQLATTTRVVVTDPSDPSRDRFVMERQFHGDANDPGNAALVYRTYGRDLDVALERLGFGVEYSREDLPELGILNTELFYCKVVRPIDSVGTDTGAPA